MTDQPEGFTLFSVLDGFLDAPDEDLAEIVEQTDAAVADLADHDVTLRGMYDVCLLYTSPSPRDVEESRMPSSA